MYLFWTPKNLQQLAISNPADSKLSNYKNPTIFNQMLIFTVIRKIITAITHLGDLKRQQDGNVTGDYIPNM